MNSYSKINYVNGSDPPLSAENLNHMDDGIEAVTEEITKLEASLDKIVAQIESLDDKVHFANSVDECTNTSLEYVLPDGYIYIYGEKSIVSYPNLLNKNTVTLNARLGTNGTTSAMNGYVTTDYIDVNVSDLDPYVLRINGDYLSLASNTRISLYDSNKTNLATYYLRSSVTDDKQTKVYSDSKGEYTHIGYYGKSDAKLDTYGDISYIRVTFAINNTQISITVDDISNIEITCDAVKTVTKTFEWMNSGVKYDGSSSTEQRVINLEQSFTDLRSEQNALAETVENISKEQSDVPDYWITAVDSISKKIKLRQSVGADAFQFVWFSDMHGVNGYQNTNGAGKSSQTNIGKLAQYLCDRFNIPLVATSGDIMSQTSHSAVSGVYTEYENCLKILSHINSDRFLATIGNHDGSWGTPVNGVYYLKDIGNRALYNEVYRRQATDFKRVFGKDGTYFYVDSLPQKVRFIMMNSHTDGDGSSDSNGNAVYNSMKNSVYGTEQLNWLTETLNSVPDGFTVIVMAHQPLSTSKDGSLTAGLLTAYMDKTTYSASVGVQGSYWGSGLNNEYTNVSVNCDFSKAKGELAAFLHGHIHKDTVDTTTYSFPCISITTAGGDVRDENPVQRIPGTATETALDIVTIDKLNKKIYCTRLGVGSDRVIDYT